MSRCTGHCCKRFILPFGPAELVAKRDKRIAWNAWRTRADSELALHGVLSPDTASARPEEMGPVDVLQIADMVEYLGYQVPGCGLESAEPQKARHFYRCKNFKDDACSIYPVRPQMCSGYPYGQKCLYVQCTWDAARGDNPPAEKTYRDHGREMTRDAIDETATADWWRGIAEGV